MFLWKHAFANTNLPHLISWAKDILETMYSRIELTRQLLRFDIYIAVATNTHQHPNEKPCTDFVHRDTRIERTYLRGFVHAYTDTLP